jgi:hypothetical protein
MAARSTRTFSSPRTTRTSKGPATADLRGGARTLKELVRSYLTISKDLARVMTRVKALYRSWVIPCTGKQVYAQRHRAQWRARIIEPRCTLPSGILLPATRCVEVLA